MFAETVFVLSDAHLGGVPDAVASALHRFLDTVPNAGDHVLINGDLFEFWFEYDSVIPRRAFPTLARLAAARHRGVRLTLTGGNHDRWGRGFWQRELGADPSVVGRTLEVNDTPVEVIGVMEPGVRLPGEPGGLRSHARAGWRDLRADAHPPRREFLGQHPHHGEQSGLGGGIVGLPGGGVDAAGGRDRHDRAAPLPHHQPPGGPAAQEGAGEVGLDHRAPLGVAHHHGVPVGGHAGVVHEGVQPPVLGPDLGEHPGHVGGVGDVGG